MGRGVEDLVACWIIVGASGSPLSGAQQLDVTPVDRHRVDLVATAGPGRGLENQLGAIEGEIRFGVFALEGELAYVPEMDLLGRLRHPGLMHGISP